MNRTEIVELVDRLAGTDISCADVESCTEVLQGFSRLVAWAEAGKVTVAQRLAALAADTPSIFPEHVVATATRVSLGRALEPFKRAKAIDALPQFGQALADGAVSAAHVDVLASAVGKLNPAERERFAARGEFLAGVAERTTPDEFGTTMCNGPPKALAA